MLLTVHFTSLTFATIVNIFIFSHRVAVGLAMAMESVCLFMQKTVMCAPAKLDSSVKTAKMVRETPEKLIDKSCRRRGFENAA